MANHPEAGTLHPPETIPTKRRDGRRILAIGVPVILIVQLYFVRAIATGTVTIHHYDTAEYYQLLADGFLAGQLYLPLKPKPELLALKDPYDGVANEYYRLHDASLFEGKYYIYFGPTPVLTLFLPYRLIFGSHLPNFVALPIFCSAAFLMLLALMLAIQKREGWQTPLWIELGMILCLGFGNLMLFLLKRPVYYEIAIAAGCCFTAAGFLFLFFAVRRPTLWWPGTLLSGVCFGLSLGCRPQLLIPIAFMGGLLFIHLLQRGNWILSLKQLAILCSPIAVLGVLLLWYNYARFHNPLEFGQGFLLSAQHTDPMRIHLKDIPTGLYDYLFSPPGLSRHPPFFRAKIGAPPWNPGRVSRTLEPIVGMFFAAPFTALPLLLPLLAKLRARAAPITVSGATGLILGSLGVFVAVLVLFIASTGWTTLRYTLDFSPAAMLLGVLVGTAMLSRLKPRLISPLGILFVLVVAGTVAVNLGLSGGSMDRDPPLSAGR